MSKLIKALISKTLFSLLVLLILYPFTNNFFALYLIIGVSVSAFLVYVKDAMLEKLPAHKKILVHALDVLFWPAALLSEVLR